jgi:hypothetical protein
MLISPWLILVGVNVPAAELIVYYYVTDPVHVTETRVYM